MPERDGPQHCMPVKHQRFGRAGIYFRLLPLSLPLLVAIKGIRGLQALSRVRCTVQTLPEGNHHFHVHEKKLVTIKMMNFS